MSVLRAAGEKFVAPEPQDFWQPLWGTGPFAFTRPMLAMALSVVLIAGVLLVTTRRLTLVPSKGQYLVEETYHFVRNSIARDIIGSREFLRFVPMLFTMFLLILVNNIFGVLPPVMFPTMSRIGFPLALVAVVFVTYHVVGIRRMGLVGYFKHMVPPGLPTWVVFILFPLEVLTYFFTRPATLALRLFGNMFAGHMVLVLFILGGEYLVLHAGNPALIPVGFLSWGLAFLMTLFELLVEFLQAYIFVLLSAMYIAGSVATDH